MKILDFVLNFQLKLKEKILPTLILRRMKEVDTLEKKKLMRLLTVLKFYLLCLSFSLIKKYNNKYTKIFIIIPNTKISVLDNVTFE